MSPTAQFYDHLRTLRDDNAALAQGLDEAKIASNRVLTALGGMSYWRSRAEAAEARVDALTARLEAALDYLDCAMRDTGWIDAEDFWVECRAALQTEGPAQPKEPTDDQ